VNETDWTQVWELFARARDLKPAARDALLAGAPPEIAAEVQGLISEEGTEPEGPAAGARYGRYTLIERLGRGGMGEVFSARDVELGRLVAIKFLNARSGAMPEAERQLLTEAQTTSALNHPNLIVIHEILRYDTGLAVVSELVKGQPLRAFCGSARPIQQVAAWGAQIANGLAAAHAESIVHRDIKPENVMIRSDGFLKVLDFGIAHHTAGPEAIATLPIGTVGYMSPEQIRGDALTPASDIFSLGVVLLELATGKHPFLEETPASTAIAIGQREVEIEVPSIAGGPAFAKLLRQMLEKDPARRPTAAAVASRLERIAQTRRFAAPWWITAGLAVGAALLWFRATASNTPVELSAPVAITNYNGIEREPSISPDGTRLLFVWNGGDGDHDEVYMRSIGGSDLRRITNDPRPKYSPIWSPDGRSIAWMSRARDGGDTLIFVAPIGGTARLAGAVADHEGFYGMEFWPDSGSIILHDRTPSGRNLIRLNLADGHKSDFTHEPNVTERSPILSPDHNRILFLRAWNTTRKLCQIDLRQQQKETCFEPDDVEIAAWLSDSHTVLYVSSQRLWQMDLDRPSLPPVAVWEGNFRDLRSSPDGTHFVFSRPIVDLNIWRLDTATGNETQFQASSGEDSEPQFSPDGTQVLFRSNRTGTYALYLCAPDGSGLRQITSLPGEVGSATWSPDGKWIAFDTSNDANGPTQFVNIAVIPSQGGAVRRVTPDDNDYSVPGWSADSRFLYCRRGNGLQMAKIPLEGGAPLVVAEHDMFDVRELPGGQLLFGHPESDRGVWIRQSTGGGESMIAGTMNTVYRSWDVRGENIYFLRQGQDGGFYSASVGAGSLRKLTGAPPRRVFHGPRNIGVSPDGKTILFTSEDLTVGDIFLMQAKPTHPKTLRFPWFR
jgi:serine/threonine protein kinase